VATQVKNVIGYLAIRYDGGAPRGFAIAGEPGKAKEFLTGDLRKAQAPDEEPLEAEEAAPGEPPKKENPLERIINRISEVMMSYYALINISYMARDIFIAAFMQGEIIDPLSQGGATLLEEGEYGKLYELEQSGLLKVIKGQEQVRRIDNGTAALPASTLMSMVAAFDSIIADLVTVLLKERKDKLNMGERSIPLSDVLASASVEEIIDRFVLNEVYELLRGSHDDQVKFIEKNFDIDIRSDWKRWADFIEVFERRNLLAHGETSFTLRYSEICRRHGKTVNIRKPGEKIELGRQYLRHAADTLLEFGVLLSFSLWRKHFKGEEQDAFAALNQAAYQFIIEGRLVVAENMLRFACGLKTTGCTEFTRRMMIVNRANALRKLKRQEEAEKVLASMDWSATSNYFQICVAAVRGDVDGVVSRMQAVKADTPVEEQRISKQEFRDWPVFDQMRTEGKFREEFERLFGEPLLSEATAVTEKSDPTGVIADEVTTDDVLADADPSTIH
jgi:hypothetical protein